jgi:hypothetical protein
VARSVRDIDPENPGRGPVSEVSDEQLWELYTELASSTKVAREVGLSDRNVRRRLAEIRDKMGPIQAADVDRAGKLEKMVSNIPLTGPGGSRLSEASVKIWGVAAKDALRQQIVTEGLDSTGAVYKFRADAGIEFEPYKSPLVPYIAHDIRPTDCERIFIVGDQQLGFWAVADPATPKHVRFIPFHDEAAIDVMLQALAIYQPDRVVIVGDFFDFPQLSRFAKEPEFERTMQASLQEGYDLLRKIRDIVGDDCKIDFILGNHETRLVRAIGQSPDTRGLYGLTRPGDQYPIHHVATLLKFNEIGIECSAEYPSGEVWLAKRRGNIPGLVVTHADPKRREMRADTIHGHLVLPSLETRQVFYEEGPVTYTRLCVSGCGNYSDTGDKVRLTRTNTPSGRARMSAVQSFGTVDIDRETGLRAYGLHLITSGSVSFNGHIIRSPLWSADAA